jgi:NAD(P)-dependent dehydrogenase (short-subunit alcohol dehydrogenase family)
MEKKFNFKNKTIFLTGANGYLGKEIQKNYHNFGANLILTDKQKYNFINKKLRYFQCDLSDPNDQLNLIKKVKNITNKIDVVINNASYTGDSKLLNWSTSFMKQDVVHWDKVFNVTLKANFQICRGLYTLLKKGKGGSIINIGSIYGFMGPDWNLYKKTSISNPAGYGISKAGLIYLTKWLASSMSPKVRVNCISSGGILRNQNIFFIKKYIKKVPLKRMCKEKDIIGSIMFLSSNSSRYITGQNLILDGGYSII